MVQVSRCCCGCSLAQGTVGTGIVSAIESILYIWTGITCINAGKDEDYHDEEETRFMVNFDTIKRMFTTLVPSCIVLLYATASQHVPVCINLLYVSAIHVPLDKPLNRLVIFNDAVKGVLHTMGVVAVVIGTLLLLTTIVLFCAVSKKKRLLIMPWIGMRGIILAFQVYGTYAMFRSDLNFLYILGNIVWICLMFYLFIVVNSYSKSLLQPVPTMGQVMPPADTANFQLVPQIPEYPHQPPDGEPNYPPSYYPIPNPTGQQMYPAVPYGLQSPQPMGAPPAYPAYSTVPADEPKKSAGVCF